MKAGVVAANDEAYQAEVLPLIREVSTAWVAMWRDVLARDGRAMEGGWPGTRSEARAWVDARVAPELVRRGFPVPTGEGAARAARDLYSVTRKAWLSEALAERS